jgi:hypothetical protein
MRRAGLVVAVLLAGVLFAAMPVAAAHHKPTHHKPGHGGPTTTTTAPTTTTTTAPTTTTTTTPPTGCEATMGVTVARARATTTAGPITITQGGTYAGFYRSDNPAIPAVTIQTSQLVELDHACIEHAGMGVFSTWTDTRLDIHDSVFRKLPSTPGAAGEQRAVYAYATARLNFDYNRLIDGDGVRFTALGSSAGAEGGSFTHNEVINVGRYQPTELVQAFQLTSDSSFDTVIPDMEVAWNKITNTFGESDVEDVISFVRSAGTSGHRIQVHHNLIDGGYPTSLGAGSFGYTGGGMNIGDGPGGPTGSSFIDAHHNWIVAAANVGILVSGGTDHEVYENVVVCTGVVNGVITGSTFGNGIYDNFGTNNVNKFIHNNTIGHLRPVNETTLVRNDVYFPSAAAPFDVYDAADDAVHTPNTFLGADPTETDYQDARDDWEAARVAAGVTIGPR